MSKKLTLRTLKKPFLSYVDSYSFYGLWDENMLVVCEDGQEKQLADFLEKVTDLGNTVSRRDAIQYLIANLSSTKEDIPLSRIFHYSMEQKEKMVNITITYFDKDFEKIYIPQKIKRVEEKAKETNQKVKLTFIYDPLIEKEGGFYSKQEMVELLKNIYSDEETVKNVLKYIA